MKETDEGRVSIHKVVDDWIDGDGGRDLVLRREFGDETHEVVKCSPPHVLDVTDRGNTVPPMPAAAPLRSERLLGRHWQHPSEAYDKLVPVELRGQKTGLNIALIADYNIAGRMTGLMRLLNRHTIHRARCVIVHDDYLSYDRDVVLTTTPVACTAATGEPAGAAGNEAQAIVEDADIYHFGRMPPPILGIDWLPRLRKDNAVIQYFGSEIRHFGQQIVDFHDRTGIIGLSAWDYTMLQPHPLFYHINNFFDVDTVGPCNHSADVVRICHATTNRAFKQSGVIRDALRRVAERTGAEIEFIEGKSHAECLAIKQRCHITVDQISSGIYGLSAIESMAMGHAVLCGMSNFALSYYPDCPVVPVSDGASLEARLCELVADRKRLRRLGGAGQVFVARTADPLTVLRQHCWIYDLVVNGHRFAGGLDEHMLGGDAT